MKGARSVVTLVILLGVLGTSAALGANLVQSLERTSRVVRNSRSCVLHRSASSLPGSARLFWTAERSG